MTTVPPALLSRLHKDLTELHDSPYPGVSVVPNEKDLRRMCLHLSPPAGPWKGLCLHFDVELPSTWPGSPPSIRSSVNGIDHPNLFGGYICCDLLKDKNDIDAESGYTGGYTPALTLRGLFLQFLTFFSTTTVEQDYGGSVYIGDAQAYHFMYEADAAKETGRPSMFMERTSLADSRETAWNRDTSEEIIVRRYGAGDDQVTHTTKRGMQKLTMKSQRIVKVAYRNPRYTRTRNLISTWCCKCCLYGSPELSPVLKQPQPKQRASATSTPLPLIPPPVCLLPRLNDDVLYVIASHLASETLISFSQAYRPLHDLVTSTHILLQRELRCFYLRTPIRTCILGIGVAHDPVARTLSSDFDWLSQEAYVRFGVRTSIQKRPFTFFLPLAFSPAHFEKARAIIWQELYRMDDHMQRTEKTRRAPTGRSPHGLLRSGARIKPFHAVRVLLKFMNNIVVSLMKSCDTVYTEGHQNASNATLLHASEKAVISYCQLFHLLISLCRTTPDIIMSATESVQAFVRDEQARQKSTLPDIGEFIVLCTLVLALPPVKLPGMTKPSPAITWKSHLNGPLLQEVIIRNARWVLREAPTLEAYEQGTSDYRLHTTFWHSKTSLRLVMFQIAFLDLFVGGSGSVNLATRLSNSYGFPEKESPSDQGAPERMVEEIKAIYKVAFWPEFFDRVHYATGRGWGKEKFSDVLRVCMQTSAKRGYHTPCRAVDLQGLRVQRVQKEREFQEQLAKKGTNNLLHH